MKTLFELVKVVLDELYEEGLKHYGSALDSEIQARAKNLSVQYTRLTDAASPKIDYADPATRFAYVYKYVASHADYVYQILNDYRSQKGGPIFNGSTLRATCIGGGPGSDLIGLLKYLGAGTEATEKVICYLCDGEQAWADAWTEVDEALAIDKVSVKVDPCVKTEMIAI